MSRTRKIFLLILILIIPGINQATDFVSKGYIINKNAIRTDGFIRFFRFDKTPDKIYFSENFTGKFTPFTPEDLKEFGYEEEKFISANVDLETSSNDIQTISNHSEFDLKQKHVFLEVIYQGTKNLFLYRHVKYHYYIGPADSPILLKTKFYLISAGNKKYKKENSTYQKQLTDYIKILSQDSGQINSIKYELKSLTKMYDQFYTTFPEQLSYKTSLRTKKHEWYALTGGTLNNFHNYEDEFNRSTFKGQASPVIGIGHAFTSLKHLWTTNIEIYYSGQVSYEGYHLEMKNEEYYTEWVTEGKYNSITVAYYIHVPFRLGYSEIYLNGGFYYNMNRYSEFNSYIQKRFYSSYEATYNPSRYHKGGWLIGSGIQKGKISAELRYTLGPSLPYNDRKFVQEIQGIMAYHF